MIGASRRALRTLLLARRHIRNWPMVLWLRFFARRPVVLLLRAGVRVACRPGTSDWTVVHEMAMAGSYAAAFQRIASCRRGGTILDLGANIGCFSLLCAALNPSIQVVAYEPEPSNVLAFEANLRLNSSLASRIRLIGKAVAGFNGIATLNVSSNIAGTNIISSHRDASTRQREVPVVPFSSIVSNIADDICLVKMDIEGSEFSVVESTPSGAWARIPAIAMEIHEDPALGMRQHQLLEQLASFGYHAQPDRMGSWFLTRSVGRFTRETD
jgi:FkbM family methyltransferase